MMKLTINDPWVLLPDYKCTFLQEAFKVAVRELRMEKYNIDVQLSVVQSGVDAEMGAATQGYTWTGHSISVHLAPMGAARMHPSQLAECLAHEMKHVQQIASGRLSIVESGIIWEGKMYDRHHILEVRYTARQETDAIVVPWEAEAYPEGRRIAAVVMEEVQP